MRDLFTIAGRMNCRISLAARKKSILIFHHCAVALSLYVQYLLCYEHIIILFNFRDFLLCDVKLLTIRRILRVCYVCGAHPVKPNMT